MQRHSACNGTLCRVPSERVHRLEQGTRPHRVRRRGYTGLPTGARARGKAGRRKNASTVPGEHAMSTVPGERPREERAADDRAQLRERSQESPGRPGA